MVSIWIKDKLGFSNEGKLGFSNEFSYFILVSGLMGSILLIIAIIILNFSRFSAKAGLDSYNKLLNLIFKKNLGFFDRTPIGRILTLVSKDQDIVDKELPYSFFLSIQVLMKYFSHLSYIFLLSISIKVCILIKLLIMGMFLLPIMRTYIELKKIFQQSFSPVLSNLNEMNSGLVIFRQSKRKMKFFDKKVNSNCNNMSRAFYH